MENNQSAFILFKTDDEKVVWRNFRHTTQHRAFEGKTH
jgi:hypothetical protein